MEIFSANSKIFKPHALLHHAAGSVKTTTYTGLGYVRFYLDFLVLVFLVT